MAPRFAPLPVLAMAAALLFAAPPASAQEPLLQCVPYARQVSGIQIFGDAHSWWQQAEGKYQRGQRPAVGAVMAFKPYRSMQLGHVATVAKVIDKRLVRVLAWYDNEWGFSNRMSDTAVALGKLL